MAGLAALVALAGTSSGGWAVDEIPVRIGVIRSGGQGDVTYVIRQSGIDRKYGLALQQVDLSAPGQPYVMLRGDTIDASPGTFVDLMRQRKAGTGLQAFHGRQRYNNLIVMRPDSAIRDFSHLKGKRVGPFSAAAQA
jgi:ABC-type nitrate/sulfonate/bicarbonate transport system substrate-binding protein